MADGETIWAGRDVYVLGYGVEGRSSVAFLVSRGATVHVRDEGSVPDHPLPDGVDFRFGADAFADIGQADVILRSPGIGRDHPALRGLAPHLFTSQVDIFLRRWRHRCIGVTGSKGKGTTVCLIGAILQEAGIPRIVAGNIGVPVLDAYDQMNDETWAVLELSSFQLQDVTASPHIGVLLMITPEHLNYHRTVEAYVEAKSHLLMHQEPEDIAVINADRQITRELAGTTPARTLFFGHGHYDAVIDGQAVTLDDGETVPVATLGSIFLRGEHNLENIAAAALAARNVGASLDAISRGAHSFQPLPHRLQPVGSAGSVMFVNDSFATTPEAAVAALRSFAEPTVLIAGGSDKGSDWTPLVQELVARREQGAMIGLVCIGDTASLIADAASETAPGLPRVINPGPMPEVVAAAWKMARDLEGPTVVLLSPGAASFGMFRDYKQRGQLFAEAVQQLRR